MLHSCQPRPTVVRLQRRYGGKEEKILIGRTVRLTTRKRADRQAVRRQRGKDQPGREAAGRRRLAVSSFSPEWLQHINNSTSTDGGGRVAEPADSYGKLPGTDGLAQPRPAYSAICRFRLRLHTIADGVTIVERQSSHYAAVVSIIADVAEKPFQNAIQSVSHRFCGQTTGARQ